MRCRSASFARFCRSRARRLGVRARAAGPRARLRLHLPSKLAENGRYMLALRLSRTRTSTISPPMSGYETPWPRPRFTRARTPATSSAVTPWKEVQLLLRAPRSQGAAARGGPGGLLRKRHAPQRGPRSHHGDAKSRELAYPRATITCLRRSGDLRVRSGYITRVRIVSAAVDNPAAAGGNHEQAPQTPP